MDKKPKNKPFTQRMAEVDILSDGNLLNVNQSDMVIENLKEHAQVEKNTPE